MPKFVVVGPLGPECMDYGLVAAESPLGALWKVHHDAVPCGLSGGALRFHDPRDQELCAGVWRVTEFRRDGNVSSVVDIAAPVLVAA